MNKNFRISMETNEMFDSIMEQLTNETPGITQGEVLARIIAAYQNQSSNEAEQIRTLNSQFNQLVSDRNALLVALGLPNDYSLSDVASYCKTQLQDIEALTASYESELKDLTESHSKQLTSVDESYRNQLTSVGEIIEQSTESHRKLEESLKKRENEISIILNSPAKEILLESCNRLSTLLNKEVTPSDLLLDVFVRYSIEQYNEWFFPFVIKPSDMKLITGYSQEELKAWLRGEPKKEV